MKHYMKDAMQISSDGDCNDWLNGYALAKSFTGLKSLKNPNARFNGLRAV